MNAEREALMLSACEFLCGDPYISLEDALADARQVAEMPELRNIPDEEDRLTLLRISCRLLSMDRNLTLDKALKRALWLYTATEEDEKSEA